MSIALTRSDLLAVERLLPKNARASTVLRALKMRLTNAEMQFEIEMERALMAGLARDPEYREARHG